jgi:RNA polymerase sigma-70 factor (ECF subfamily)
MIRHRMNTSSLDFNTLHDQFRPRVLRYVTRLVGEAEAEDVTQSVMLKVNEGLSGFRGDSSVSTWIYRIATNVAVDRLRQKATQQLTDAEHEFDEDDLPPAVQSPSAETTAIREEMSACIGEFVARLPENYKTVMILSELEGLTNGEIAAVLGLTLDTVKIRLHRAREKLRKDLEAGCNLYRDERAEFACDRKPAAPISFSPRR